MDEHISELFKIVNDDKQVSKWIETFTNTNRIFAVLKLGGSLLKKEYLDDIAKDITLLSKLKLPAPIVYGWGDEFTDLLKSKGIARIQHKSGVWITEKSHLSYLEQIAETQGNILVEKLKDLGVKSQICYNVFNAKTKELKEVYNHYTGKVVSVNSDEIKNLLSKNIIPLIPPIGYGKTLLNINGDTGATDLIRALDPLKFISLTSVGGIYDSNFNLIRKISIASDYSKTIQVVSGGALVKLEEAIRGIILSPSKDLAVQIAHPKNLPIELFTNYGAGTYITK